MSDLNVKNDDRPVITKEMLEAGYNACDWSSEMLENDPHEVLTWIFEAMFDVWFRSENRG